MKKVLAVFGSPRKNGISATIHEAFLEGGEFSHITRIHVYDLSIQPCTACGKCKELLYCPICDDMTNLYHLIDACDIMSISTPIYFSSPPAPLKAMIDRCQPFWERKCREGKRNTLKQGFLIAVGGSNYANMFMSTRQIMRHFFQTCGFDANEQCWIMVQNTDAVHDVKDLLQCAKEKGKALKNYSS